MLVALGGKGGRRSSPVIGLFAAVRGVSESSDLASISPDASLGFRTASLLSTSFGGEGAELLPSAVSPSSLVTADPSSSRPICDKITNKSIRGVLGPLSNVKALLEKGRGWRSRGGLAVRQEASGVVEVSRLCCLLIQATIPQSFPFSNAFGFVRSNLDFLRHCHRHVHAQRIHSC